MIIKVFLINFLFFNNTTNPKPELAIKPDVRAPNDNWFSVNIFTNNTLDAQFGINPTKAAIRGVIYLFFSKNVIILKEPIK